MEVGKMDWETCKKKTLVKEIKIDTNLIEDLKQAAEKKLISEKRLELDDISASSKITLCYDALREYLEALTIQKQFKIYNHECHCAFLKEIIKDSSLAERFNKVRLVRNSINYYGKDISVDEAKEILDEIKEILTTVKKILL